MCLINIIKKLKLDNYKSNNTKNPINIIFLSKMLNLIVKIIIVRPF